MHDHERQVQHSCQALHLTFVRVQVVPEPVDKWQDIGDGHHNVLKAFYDNQERFAYTFQNYVFVTRMMQVWRKEFGLLLTARFHAVLLEHLASHHLRNVCCTMCLKAICHSSSVCAAQHCP